MKVGMIGLGRTGEGMSRRMIEKGIEVWGYSSSSYENACGQYEAGYISGCVTSLEYLVQAVKSDGLRYTSAGKVPGIFQITLPEQKTEDTLDELLPLLELVTRRQNHRAQPSTLYLLIHLVQNPVRSASEDRG